MIASCTTRMTCKVVFWPESALCSELLSAFMVSGESEETFQSNLLVFLLAFIITRKTNLKDDTEPAKRPKRNERNEITETTETKPARNESTETDEYDRGLGVLQNLNMPSSDNLLIRRNPNCETFILRACILLILWQFPHSYQLTQ